MIFYGTSYNFCTSALIFTSINIIYFYFIIILSYFMLQYTLTKEYGNWPSLNDLDLDR
jgi:hypothetical protein